VPTYFREWCSVFQKDIDRGDSTRGDDVILLTMLSLSAKFFCTATKQTAILQPKPLYDTIHCINLFLSRIDSCKAAIRKTKCEWEEWESTTGSDVEEFYFLPPLPAGRQA
jgi:hypothetical protein